MKRATESTPLSSRQREVLHALVDLGLDGRSPSFREISSAVGISGLNAVARHIRILEARRYITREPRRARSIRILKMPESVFAHRAA